MTHRRQRALAALALFALAVAGAIAIAVSAFPRGLFSLGFVAIALPLAWYGALREGVRRVASLAAAGVLLAAVIALMIFVDPLLGELAVVLTLALALVAARAAFTARVELPAAPRPKHAVVFWNPKAGGGKAEKAHLDEEARRRGIEPVKLSLGDDLEALVAEAVAGGADALAAAGGDGTQAIVANAAAERGLPYACIPAGTRNHFALDLGVDRDDVVGALDALVDGCERRVDLAEVNGTVFVNNVSLGIYAQAVQREGYREAKLRTIAQAVPDTLGPDGTPLDLRWDGPDGHEHASGAVILVSNNPYRLRPVGAGTRARLDTGTLGVTVFEPGHGRGRRAVLQWAVAAFDVRSAGPVPAGLDGEAVSLDPPVRFASRPGALIVRLARHHPGASPAAALPESVVDALRRLFALAAGRED
jgi:diacylglycerol kinase family enzyme